MIMKAEILRLLRETDGYVSGQELCNQFGVSRTAVWKAINQLKEAGYEIEAVQNNCTAEFVKTDFSVTLNVCVKKSLIEKRFNCFFRIPCEVPQAKGFRCI